MADADINLTPNTGTFAGAARGIDNGNTHDHIGGDGAQIDHTGLSNIGTNTHAQIDTHIASTSNPHVVTASQVSAIPNSTITAAGDYIRGTGVGTYTAQKNNFAAIIAPTATDDSASGYSVGSRWIDTVTDKEYVCLDATATAAVWTETTQAAASLALNDLTDVTITGAAQGDVLYRNGTEWVNLGAGTSGQYLKTNGAGANPQWSSPSGSGDMTKAVYDPNDDGIIAVPAGGTGKNTVTENSYIRGGAANTYVERTASEVKTDLSLNNVENTALSTWAGSANITTLGTVTTGTLSTGVIIPIEIGVACSDETTALTTGTAKITFRAPYAFTVTSVRSNVNTAPTGSTLIVDINEGGTSILSTKLSIDDGEKTSVTAATPPVISDSAIADDAEITIDIDQIGSTIAGKGLKIWMRGTRTI
jgi:hypothetical protein